MKVSLISVLLYKNIETDDDCRDLTTNNYANDAILYYTYKSKIA